MNFFDNIDYKRALINGVLVGSYVKYRYPTAGLNMPGIGVDKVPLWGIQGVGAIGSDLINDVVHKAVYPLINPKEKLNDPRTKIFSLGVSGLSYMGLMRLTDDQLISNLGGFNLFFQGAAFNSISHGVSNNLALF